jgi:hypothetical protein
MPTVLQQVEHLLRALPIQRFRKEVS